MLPKRRGNIMAAVSKEEYLKRYLSGDTNAEKKKKVKKRVKAITKPNRMKIIDDDVNMHSLLPSNLGNTLEEDVGDNEPTVADFVDERPEDVKQLESFRESGKWKTMAKEQNGSSFSNKQRHDSDSDQSPIRRGGRHDSESDQSPPRRQRHDSDQSPPRRQRHDSDQSPPRRKMNDSDQSPPRRQRHDSDQSPPRRKIHNSDKSPPRRQRHDSDQSPPRKRKNHSDSDQSPPRRSKVTSDKTGLIGIFKSNSKSRPKTRHDSDSDQSPHWRKSKSDLSSRRSIDQSPPRRKNRFESNQSPPRRQKRQDSDSDQSPPRKQKRHDSDQPPPRRENVRSSDKTYRTEQTRSEKAPDKRLDGHRSKSKDNSRDREHSKSHSSKSRRHDSDSDLSPPRRKPKTEPESPRTKGKGDSPDERMKKTLSGKMAGISSAREMRKEAEKLRQKEDEAFGQIDDDTLGRNATTVFRDKSGKRRNLKEEKRQQKAEERQKVEEEEKYLEWGKGVKQREDQRQTVEDTLYEMSKPLARYKDDSDLDKMLKEQDRAGDPMLAFMKKKKKSASGVSVPEKPRYRGPMPPPNRFNIHPGYRWDGVDRSNGFEKKYFMKQASKKAVANDAYKWSTEDM